MKRFKVWLLLALVFAAGFAGGIVTARVSIRHFVRQAIAHPELVRDRIERNLDRRLRLDARQQEQVHEMLVRSHDRLKSLRAEFQPRLRALLEDLHHEVDGVLTPEQRARLDAFLEENRAFWQPQ